MNSIVRNEIEAVLGIQLYCVFNADEDGIVLPEPTKIYRFNANIDIPTFQANQAYFFGFMDWLRENYHSALDTMVPFIPDIRKEYVLQRCAFIVAATFQPDDIVKLKSIQNKLNIPAERANIIVNEIIDSVKFELEMQNFIRDYGRYGFKSDAVFKELQLSSNENYIEF